jgi:hypothetical protein
LAPLFKKLVVSQAFCYYCDKEDSKIKNRGNIMDQLDAFIKEIIDTKQLPGITEEAKAGLAEEMRERLLDQINRALIDSLPDDKVEALSQLLDGDTVDDAQIQAFVADSGVNVEEVTAKTMIAFRALYLQGPGERA